jgi:hypothetical protein
MWDKAIARSPIASFNLPAQRPEAVEEAYARFDAVGDELGRVRGEIEDAEDALVAAEAADLRRVADAAGAGKSVDPEQEQKTARARLEELRARLPGLTLAVDEAGNEVARAIAEARSEWIEQLTATIASTAAGYEAAIEAARAAAATLGPAVQGIEWLREFEVGPATVGRVSQFPGGRLRLNVRRLFLPGSPPHLDIREPVDADVLLAVAAKATDPSVLGVAPKGAA